MTNILTTLSFLKQWIMWSWYIYGRKLRVLKYTASLIVLEALQYLQVVPDSLIQSHIFKLKFCQQNMVHIFIRNVLHFQSANTHDTKYVTTTEKLRVLKYWPPCRPGGSLGSGSCSWRSLHTDSPRLPDSRGDPPAGARCQPRAARSPCVPPPRSPASPASYGGRSPPG